MLMFGLFALVAGVVLVVGGFAARSFAKQFEAGAAPAGNGSKVIEL